MNNKRQEETRNGYWDATYKSRKRHPEPSPFAKFVSRCVTDQCLIIDVGCGDGRDSEFFLQKGHSVIGIDASPEGLALAGNRAKEKSSRARFILADFDRPFSSDHEATRAFESARLDLGESNSKDTVVYARFFLHAINDLEEYHFLTWLQSVCRSKEQVFLEYRTLQDAQRTKTFGNHSRRYVDPSGFLLRAKSFGFRGQTLVEGTGLANFHDEDPVVCRQILSRMDQ